MVYKELLVSDKLFGLQKYGCFHLHDSALNGYFAFATKHKLPYAKIVILADSRSISPKKINAGAICAENLQEGLVKLDHQVFENRPAGGGAVEGDCNTQGVASLCTGLGACWTFIPLHVKAES